MESSLETACLSFLLESQNSDGGWGFRPRTASGTEPTAWGMLALNGLDDSSQLREPMRRAEQWLRAAQLPDGSWPPYPGLPGSWVTSLACLALLARGGEREEASRGLRWTCQSWPGEGSLWWRFCAWFRREPTLVRQDHSLRGWSWTPGTSSWVEPTSLALLALNRFPDERLLRGAARRRRLGEAMLYDRMCPGGGWNAGNPQVYGVAGEPSVGPTAWALLALRRYAERPENQQSLEWLERTGKSATGPGSLALAQLCLQAYGRPGEAVAAALRNSYERNRFLHSIPVTACVMTALSARNSWRDLISGGNRR